MHLSCRLRGRSWYLKECLTHPKQSRRVRFYDVTCTLWDCRLPLNLALFSQTCRRNFSYNLVRRVRDEPIENTGKVIFWSVWNLLQDKSLCLPVKATKNINRRDFLQSSQSTVVMVTHQKRRYHYVINVTRLSQVSFLVECFEFQCGRDMLKLWPNKAKEMKLRFLPWYITWCSPAHISLLFGCVYRRKQIACLVGTFWFSI